MYVYELSDILFFIKSVKSPTNSFDIIIELRMYLLQEILLDFLTPNFFTELPITTAHQIHIFTEFLSFGMLSPKLICLSPCIQKMKYLFMELFYA